MGDARRAVPSDAGELVRLRGLMLACMSGSSASSTSVPTRRTADGVTAEPA
ncbi:hypothetical protein [Micromonospora aurantiaca (nom. illeg.)]|uniref:hypothetical protein n=1 Tax=Micromonospora aurantiaca (nom. illeg.) TaxID=47850 RepID=UPI0035B4531A